MGPICFLETSLTTRNYQSTVHSSPEERGYQINIFCVV